MPLFKVVLMVVWLSNANGSIVRRRFQASQLTAQLVNVWPPRKIADESANPDLGGSTATFWCWNTSTKIQAREQLVPGSVVL